MQLRFVESFYWAATFKSVSSAALKLHVTQSALSARINALEEEMGCTLLDRRNKQVQLTPAGSTFYDYAQRLLALQAQALEDVGASQRSGHSLRIGVLESGMHSWLMPMLSKLKQQQTTLALELTVETSQLLVDQLKRGAHDIVFTSVPNQDEGIHTEQYGRMPMAFVGLQKIHRKRSYTLAELAEFELITFQKGSQPHTKLLALLREHKLQAKRVHAVSSISAMVPMIQHGLGIATLPQKVAQHFAPLQGLRILPCKTAPEALPIFASYRATTPDQSEMQSEAITQLCRDLRAALSV